MAALLSDEDVGLTAPSPEAPKGGLLSDADVGLKPAFGSDEYVKQMAAKHGLSEDYVRRDAQRAGSNEFAKGVPILGGLAERGMAAVAAAGMGGPSGGYGDRYSKLRDYYNELQQDYENEHPIKSTAAQLGGGLLTTGGLGMTATGAKALGAVGGGLGRQMLASGASGAAIGAADAAVRGEDPTTAAGWGAGLGIGGPALGRVLGAATEQARNMARGLLPPTAPENITHVAGRPVSLTSGEFTGDLPTQQFEQAAQRGALGEAPQRVTEPFRARQAQEIEGARSGIASDFDPAYGQTYAGDAHEAGSMVQDAMRQNYARSRQNVQNLYNQAFSNQGDIHASAFTGIADRIKSALSNRAEPVVVDNVTTPVANQALADIERTIDQLRVPNRAAPGGQPDPNSIVGINLQGVDQIKKRLNAIRKNAVPGSGDQRAVTAIAHEFENQIDDAISQRLFTGQSDIALQQLRAARTAYSTHASLYGSQKNDEGIGRIIEKIVGRNGYQGSTPNEIANWLYGANGLGASGTSNRLAQRIREIVGENSPAWIAIKQGLWQRLTQAAEGGTQMGPQMVANRIAKFLNGPGIDLAQTMFSPAERQQMQNFGNLMSQMVPRPGAVNFSNTAGTLAMLARHALRGVYYTMGHAALGPIAGIAAAHYGPAAAAALHQSSTAGAVARSFHHSPARQRAEAMLAEQMGRYGALSSRAMQLGMHPAKQAPDGEHYLEDPTRPGKYLRVDAR